MAEEQTGATDAPNGRAQKTGRRRLRGFGSYILSLLLIVVPIGVAYYLHVESQTDYHQDRAFRALDEINQLLEDNVRSVENLYLLLPSKFGEKDPDNLRGKLQSLHQEVDNAKEAFANAVSRLPESPPGRSQTSGNSSGGWAKDIESLDRQLDALISLNGEGWPKTDYMTTPATRLVMTGNEYLEDIDAELRGTAVPQAEEGSGAPVQPEQPACQAPYVEETLPGQIRACFVQFMVALKDHLSTDSDTYALKRETATFVKGLPSLQELGKIRTSEAFTSLSDGANGALPNILEEVVKDTHGYFSSDSLQDEITEAIEEVAKQEALLKPLTDMGLTNADEAHDWLDNNIESVLAAKQVIVAAFGLKAELRPGVVSFRQTLKESGSGAIEEPTLSPSCSAAPETWACQIASLESEIQSLTKAVNSILLATTQDHALTEVRSYLANIGRRPSFKDISLHPVEGEQPSVATEADTALSSAPGENTPKETCDTKGASRTELSYQAARRGMVLSVSKCVDASINLPGILKKISDRKQELRFKKEEANFKALMRFDVPLDTLMQEVRYRREFDRILIADADGDVLAELETKEHRHVSDEGGSRFRNVSLLLRRAHLLAAGVDFDEDDGKLHEELLNETQHKSGLGQATFVEFDRGDSSALAFIRPVKYQMAISSNGSPAVSTTPGAAQTLHFIGIVKKSTFMTKAWRVSPMAVTVAGILFVFGILATPFIKLVLSGQHDSVGRGVAFFTLACGVMGIVMLSLLLLNFTLGQVMEAVFDDTAEVAAEQLEQDIRQELGTMLAAAEADLRACAASGTCKSSFTGDLENQWPAYQSAGATDKDGTLLGRVMSTYRKFKVRADGDVSSRQYFQDADNGEGTTFDYVGDGGNGIKGNKTALIALERVVNLSDALKTTTIALGRDFTTEMLAFKSVHVKSCGRVPEVGSAAQELRNVFGDYFRPLLPGDRHKARAGEQVGDKKPDEGSRFIQSPNTDQSACDPERPVSRKASEKPPHVTVIGGPLKTFAAPVMPLGFQFSVFDARTGKSVANSRGYWDMTENVIRETDHNPVLKLAVAKKQVMSFGARYYGDPVQMHARPIGGTNWMAVVHYDKPFLQATRVQIMLIAFAETLAVIALGMLPVILWRMYGVDRWSWLFPMRCGTPQEQVFFRHAQALALAILAGLAILFVLLLDGYLRLLCMVTMIHILIYVRYVCSGQPFLHPRHARRLWWNPVLCSLGILFLVGLVVLPIVEGGFAFRHASFGFLIAGTVLVLWMFSATIGSRYSKLSGQGAGTVVTVSSQKRWYIGTMTASLMLVAVLPSIAAYLDAFTSYNNLVHRYALLDAAEKIDNRYKYLRTYFAALYPQGAYTGDIKPEEKSFAGETSELETVPQEAVRGIIARRDIHVHAKGRAETLEDGRLQYRWAQEPQGAPDAMLPDKGAGFFLTSLMPPVREGLRPFQIPAADEGLPAKGADRAWYWETQDGKTKLWYKASNAVQDASTRKTKGWLQLDFQHSNVSDVIGASHISQLMQALLAGVLLMGLIYWVIEKVVRQLAAIDVPLLRLNSKRAAAGEVLHRMILRPTARRISEIDREVRDSRASQAKNGRTAWLNLADGVLTDAQWSGQEPPISHLAIIGFEALIADKTRRAAALTLLEGLVQTRPDIRLTLLCGHNLLFRLVRPDAYRDEVDVPHNVHAAECLRWGSLLARFRKEYGWFPSDSPDWDSWRQAETEAEAMFRRESRIFPEVCLPEGKGWFAPTSGQFATFAIQYLPLSDGSNGDRKIDFGACCCDEIFEVAGMFGGAYFRKLWAESTHGEKLALYQLASGKVLNTRNVELIGHLMRRGLIVAEPQLKITSEAFARFVLAAETRETFQAWEEEAARSMWTVYRVPLIVLMMVLAVFLLSTARQEIDAAMGVLTGALALVPVLMRGVNILKGS